MKIRSILALLLCIALFFTACSHSTNESDEQKNGPAVPDGFDPGPPYVLSSLTEFNANVQQYQKLLEVGYPSVEDPSVVEDFSFQHYQGLYWYTLNYTIDGVWYQFSYTGYDQKTDAGSGIPCTTAEICGRPVTFYQTANKMSGVFYIEDYRIWISVRNYGQISDVDFSHFTWITAADTTP